MPVFSGLIPTITVSKNSQINSLTKGLLDNIVTSSASYALSPVLGTGLANALGLGPVNGSNFLQSIVTPGLISTGAGALSQVVATSITNSKSLGPFGPLAGSLAQAGINYLAKEATDALFGKSSTGATTGGTQYFPGAGGIGEGTANYLGSAAGSLIPKQQAYTLGNGGPDVIFTISEFVQIPQAQAAAATAPAPAPAPASGAGTGTANPADGSSASPPAGTPNPGAKPPEKPAAGKTFSDKNPASPATRTGWSFICPPDDISWETSAQADRLSIFGTNQSPVIGGVKGMRDLTLNNAIVEGFTRGKVVEDKIIELERLMDMKPSTDGRNLTIPVYQVTAQGKVYGNGYAGIERGLFVVKSVKVSEKMRDLDGKTTRAIVDISLTQVPFYQVGRARDSASPTITGAKGPFAALAEAATATIAEQAAQGVPPAKR